MWLIPGKPLFGQDRVLDAKLHHVRSGDQPEWASFPALPEAKYLEIRFTAQVNKSAYTLQLRQQDVKQAWRVLLNDSILGPLVTDEKDMRTYLPVPAGRLKTGENIMRVATASPFSDDIRVGEVVLDNRPVNQVLNEALVEVEVLDAKTKQPLPARITIVNAAGILQPVSTLQSDLLATRTGVVYTGNGKVSIHLPAGSYRLYAGRGFEYSVDSVNLNLKTGERKVIKLAIQAEVPTAGWISSDTHVHTFTHSGHGDATVAERAVTLAGEGIELPIITDHNKHIDISQEVKQLGLNKYFTPVMGSEVTTPVGHFNIFPVAPDAPMSNYWAKDWNALALTLGPPAASNAIILNHARDEHAGFRPFDPAHHLAPAGRTLTGWTFPANAMEVINSGALQTDNHQLLHDWFGMLNGGYQVTPVGSSDSHDVSRYIVGQGRTYIRSSATNPGQINVAEAVNNFTAGKVMVSLGLLTELLVENKYGPGELVPAAGEVQVTVRVLGPSWVRAKRVTLYANGRKIQKVNISNQTAAGVKWSGSWQLPLSKQDVFLVAVADGPAGSMPYWPLVKPYQPTGPHWEPLVMGASGAVWIDADKDNKRTSAKEYATQILLSAKDNPGKIIKKLAPYDEAVAISVASQLQVQGIHLTGNKFTKALQKAKPRTLAGFEQFRKAWQETQQAAAVQK
ncbi:hypothetical protein AAE02nite_41480 [Adhaeribacter aerolatus]|uniref:Polymerase/histidinol phosphatase N-terminal domain-containing protein n=2 Tax=Adhaeribacter aerolatus TaxID=670289 RepID=A0A512B3F3_9BACT|nr:hypothetical protein AAE02nite_41480 [Adhaeribacter aerolatus]